MEGTLIDSNGIWKDVDIAFLKKRGFAYTRAYYEGVAHTIFPLAAKFTKEYCHLSESTEEIMAEWMEMAGDAYATRVPVKPGVQAYLDRCRALAIDRALNTADLAGEELFVCTSPADAGLPEVTPPHYTMHTGKRIGIDYAEEAADFPWRFWLEREDG